MKIPEITDHDLLTLIKHIKPLMEVPDLGLHYINIKNITLQELRQTSFIWDKKSGGKVRRPLKKKESITTYHSFGAPILFKPSIAEVLSQLSPEQRSWCKGFVINEDLTINDIHPDELHHITTTHLYGY